MHEYKEKYNNSGKWPDPRKVKILIENVRLKFLIVVSLSKPKYGKVANETQYEEKIQYNYQTSYMFIVYSKYEKLMTMRYYFWK